MSPEIIGMSASIGYAVGTAVDLAAQRIHDRNTIPVSLQLPGSEGVAQHANRRRAGRLVSGIGAIGIGIGALSALAFESSAPDSITAIEVVVDHSGPVAGSLANASKGPTPLEREDAIVQALDRKDHINPSFLVAKLGNSAFGTAQEVYKDDPYGEANLATATGTALSISTPITIQGGKSAVVVLTNGNGVGDSQYLRNNLVAKPADRTPIYVVNVRSQDPQEAATKNLKELAQKTGGMYWDTSKTDAGQVVDTITQAVKPLEKPGNDNTGNRILYGALATLLTGFGAVQAKRATQPLHEQSKKGKE